MVYGGEVCWEPLFGFLVVAEIVLGSLGGGHAVCFVSVPVDLLQRELLVAPEVPLVVVHREDEIGVGAGDGEDVGVGFVPAVEYGGVGHAVVLCSWRGPTARRSISFCFLLSGYRFLL